MIDDPEHPDPENLDVAKVARAWWRDLTRPPGKRNRDRIGAAELRRSSDPSEIVLVSAFSRLRHRLGARSERSLQRVAMIAHVLAHVREDDRRSVAGALGHDHGDARAPMSAARFRRLLQARDDTDRTRRLVRTVKMLNGKANVGDLAAAIWRWDEDVRREWALRYLDAEPLPGNMRVFPRHRETHR